MHLAEGVTEKLWRGFCGRCVDLDAGLGGALELGPLEVRDAGPLEVRDAGQAQRPGLVRRG